MTSSTDSTIPTQGKHPVPAHRPWAIRPDARAVEIRFRRDRDGWRRRIDCARRTAHDGRDELVAPYAGRWTR
jgi:hypothetical protein